MYFTNNKYLLNFVFIFNKKKLFQNNEVCKYIESGFWLHLYGFARGKHYML